MKYYIVWFLLLFTSFEGFGLRSESWGGLGSSFLGWFGLLQLIVLVMVMAMPFLMKPKFYFSRKRAIGLPTLLMISLLVIAFLQSAASSLVLGESPIIEVFRNFVKMKYIVMYFIFVYLLERPNGIKVATNIIIVTALVSSIIAMSIVLFNYQSYVVKVFASSYVGSKFRVILPTGILIGAGFFFLISKFNCTKKILYLIGAFVCLSAIILQLHRGVLLSILILILYIYYKNIQKSRKNALLIIPIIGLLLLSALFISDQIGYGITSLVRNIIHTRKEIENISGNFGVRIFLPIHSLFYVIKKYIVLGVGLHWQEISNFKAYVTEQFVAGPTLDSGYNNIIIVYGLSGMAVYGYLFIRLYNSIKRISTNYIKNQALGNGIMYLFLYIMLTSVSSDNFLLYNSTFIFVLLIAYVYVLEGKLNGDHEKNYSPS